jgi:hypothetical protein
MFIGMTTAPTMRSATERLTMYRFPTVCSFRSLRTAYSTSRLRPTVTREILLKTTTKGISWGLAMVVLFPSHIVSSKTWEELARLIGTKAASSYGSLPGGKDRGVRSEISGQKVHHSYQTEVVGLGHLPSKHMALSSNLSTT